MSNFIHEIRAYELLDQAGLATPRRGIIASGKAGAALPFKAGERVVIKGVADEVWHKSDIGLVRFTEYDAQAIAATAAELEGIGKAHGAWIGTMVAEMVPFKKVSGLPTEALVALRKSPEAGWTVVVGIGGLRTNAWGEEIKPMLWPVAFTTPEQALSDFKAHWLGKIWLGDMRQGEALTDEPKLLAFLRGLWKLTELLDAEQATLLEMNPVVIAPDGHPTALDGVGSIDAQAGEPILGPSISTDDLLRILVKPRSIALAGISAKGGPGRTIMENLLASELPKNAIFPIKPGETEILGVPCLNGIADLVKQPVDILILSLPAPLTVEAIEQLCEQGCGAQVVYLVPGGLGDGADTEGRGARVVKLLQERRRKGLWTPALVGPNGLGFLTCEGRINTLFIPPVKLPFVPTGGSLSMVSQSGAFLITRLSTQPNLPLRYGVSIGNQIDVRMSDFITALSQDEGTKVIAAYIEGFAPGDLVKVARASQQAIARGKWVVVYKGGRSAAGQKAASSHTGALAGDWDLQKALLKRAGVLVCERMSLFDGVLAWLSAHSAGKPSRVAVMTNAGYESVVSADILEDCITGHHLDTAEETELRRLIEGHQLQDLVAAHLPLDLTPMANGQAYLDSARLVAKSAADTVVVGLVPLTQRLETVDEAAMAAYAEAMRTVAQESGKRVGIVVEAGPLYGPYRTAFERAGLPVFTSMERALESLRHIAEM